MIVQSIKDLLTPKMLKYSIVPFLLTLVVMYVLFFIVAGIGVDQLGEMSVHSSQTTMQNGIPHTESFDTMIEGTAIIQFLMSYAITSWIATFLIYALGSFAVLYMSIFIAVIVIGFLTPFVLKELQFRHYGDVDMIGYSNIFESIFLVFKWAVIMLLLFILLVPFYFIPLVNIVAFNLPLYYFFHKMITFDIASNICTKEEDKQIKYFRGSSIKFKTLTLYLLSLIPFVIFFGAIFYVIYLGHTYFIEVRKIRNNVQ
ncbi:EI24 domain-containing protein [Sulfurimonas sp.]|uniref:EI24 domain-containing protein n=1 Tax=Sulfurimonas sp. TaxID=2022749 RepID=UPI002B45FE52|nr:EI24 domain-containing protein [Sulfurimonas sp.]